MKKLSITLDCKPPTAADEDALGPLLSGVNAIYMAIALEIESVPVSVGLSKILVERRAELVSNIADCNRMTAFVTFHNMGPWAEISFSNGKHLVEKFTICFQVATGEFLVVAQ